MKGMIQMTITKMITTYWKTKQLSLYLNIDLVVSILMLNIILFLTSFINHDSLFLSTFKNH